MASDATNSNSGSDPPPLPKDWDRCQLWMERKRRYCRQQPFAKGEKYCGNHRHLALSQQQQQQQHHHHEETAGRSSPAPTQRKRIPCPLDPSHWIFEDTVAMHIEKCPRNKKRKLQQQEPYFKENVNGGGFGLLRESDEKIATETNATFCCHRSSASFPFDSKNDTVGTAEWSQAIAKRVLQVHQRIFGSARSDRSLDDVCSLTAQDIHDTLPFRDFSRPELQAGISHAFESHHIKSGGARHIPQLASLIGHLRQMNVLPSLPNHDDTNETKAVIQNKKSLLFIEMGAGRGIFGLAAASVANVDKDTTVHLILVERTGSRSKAETGFRNIPKVVDTSYMKLEGVQWSRCSCDLAHIHLPVLLQREEFQNSKIVVIAKHLCGAGTDLALKSLASIRTKVDACIFATCCHGVCDWQHFVGRDYLRQVMEEETEARGKNEAISNDNRLFFGPAEFELLRRWCAACASGTEVEHGEPETNPLESTKLGDFSEHRCCDSGIVSTKSIIHDRDTNLSYSTSISSVVKSLRLKCGMQGLGRACQRLIDHGRLEYLRHQIFPESSSVVDLCHYVSRDISPQNAVLVAHKTLIDLDEEHQS